MWKNVTGFVSFFFYLWHFFTSVSLDCGMTLKHPMTSSFGRTGRVVTFDLFYSVVTNHHFKNTKWIDRRTIYVKFKVDMKISPFLKNLFFITDESRSGLWGEESTERNRPPPGQPQDQMILCTCVTEECGDRKWWRCVDRVTCVHVDRCMCPCVSTVWSRNVGLPRSITYIL